MSPKRKKFIEEYLKRWNATDAAEAAGFKGDRASLAATGSRLLRDVNIKAAISARLTESAMSADEALMRLGDMARGDLGDFADVNFREDLKDHPLSHLIKELTVTTSESGGKIQHRLNIKLHDAQKALVDILKEHGRFVQEVKHSGTLENKLIILPPKDDN